MLLNAYNSDGHCVDRQSAAKEYKMKRVLVIVLVAAGLVLAPYAGSVNAQGSTSGRPPVGQPLVSEGEFAVELATALHLTSTHDEAAAENSLAAINIAPRNGWISDYPMTPDIIAEVRESAARSASSRSLSLSEADAARAVDSVSIAMHLPIKVAGKKRADDSGSGSGSEYQSSPASPPPEVSEYETPDNVEQYYDENGPPIVSYYPPPWEYDYLYAWVPWPFWWDEFEFGGFFILNDFNRHHHNHWFSNHVTHADGTVSRVNAVTRAAGTGTRNPSTLSGKNTSTHGSGFGSANAQTRARAIMDRQNALRNPVAATRNMHSSESTGSGRTMGQGGDSRSSSFSGRTSGGAQSGRSFSGGEGYHQSGSSGGSHDSGGGYSGGGGGGYSGGGGSHDSGGGGGYSGGGGSHDSGGGGGYSGGGSGGGYSGGGGGGGFGGGGGGGGHR
jgi:hypothetical protein